MTHFFLKLSNTLFGSLTIKARMLLQVGVIIASLLLFVALSYVSSTKMSSSIESMDKEDLSFLMATNTLKYETFKLKDSVYSFISKTKITTAMATEYTTSLNAQGKIIQDHLSEVESLIKTIDNPKLHELFKIIKQRNTALIGNSVSLIETYMDPLSSQEDKTFDFSSFQNIASMINQEMESLTFIAFDGFKTQLTSVSAESEDAKVQNLILSFAIGSIILFATFLILISITTPLEIFKNGVSEFFSFLNGDTKQTQTINIHTKDEIGLMAKAVNNSIQTIEKGMVADAKMITETKAIITKIKNGEFDIHLNSQPQSESLIELQTAINEMLFSLKNNIGINLNDILASINSFSEMDFTRKVSSNHGKLEKNINKLASDISLVLSDNLKHGLVLQDNALQLRDAFEKLSLSANRQASSLEETSASIEEITGNIKLNNDKTILMEALANGSKKVAMEGNNFVEQNKQAMDEIDVGTKNISEAINQIEQIAFQTNILSLNAAVEAATAGEHGKGFAVVAAEVRNLASKSADAAKQIKLLVNQATEKTAKGKITSEQISNAFKTLVEKITDTVEIVEEVAIASKEQLIGMEQIAHASNELDKLTQENAQTTRHTDDIASSVLHIAENIVSTAQEKKFIQ